MILITFLLLIILDIHYLVIVLKQLHRVELKLMLRGRRCEPRQQLRLRVVEVVRTHIIMDQCYWPLVKATPVWSLVACLLQGFTWGSGVHSSPSLMDFQKGARVVAASLFYLAFLLDNRLWLWDDV
jgi:hypothetical protein